MKLADRETGLPNLYVLCPSRDWASKRVCAVSGRLLHLNMTTALHSTLSSLRSALEAERARASIQLADSSLDGSGVKDLASGSLGCCLRGANDPCQFRLVKKSSVRELRWSPPLLIPTSEMRTRAHSEAPLFFFPQQHLLTALFRVRSPMCGSHVWVYAH